MATRVLLCIFFLVWGILIGAALVGVYSLVPDDHNFFKITISDLLNVATPLAIAVFVTYFVSTALNNESRKRDVTLDYIDRVSTAGDALFEVGSKYIEDQSSYRKIIISLLQNTSILISNLERVLVSQNQDTTLVVPIKEAFKDIKKALTNSSRSGNGDAITPEQCSQFMEGYRKLVEGTSTLKFSILK